MAFSNLRNAQPQMIHDETMKCIRISFPVGNTQHASAATKPTKDTRKPAKGTRKLVKDTPKPTKDTREPTLDTNEQIPDSSTQKQGPPPQVVYPPVTLLGKSSEDAGQVPYLCSEARTILPNRIAEQPYKRPGRPMNCFMLYRRDMHPRFAAMFPQLRNVQLCKPLNPNFRSSLLTCYPAIVIGQAWRNETQATKDYYANLAIEERKKHAMTYPSYRFTPRKTEEIKRRAKKQKVREFNVSNAPLNFLKPSFYEMTQSQLVSGGVHINSDDIKSVEHETSHELLQKVALMDARPYVNMSPATLADQVAYGAVLDGDDLAVQASDNLSYEAQVARDLASVLSPLGQSNTAFGSTSSESAVLAENNYDSFCASTLRNAELVGQGILDPLDTFNFEERDLTLDFNTFNDGMGSGSQFSY